MKNYTKTHTNPKAADAHLSNIKRRGGTATVTQTKDGTRIDYYFPEPKVTKKSGTKKKAAESVSKETGTTKRREINANVLLDILSPDGLTIRTGKQGYFKNMEELRAYFAVWKKRFEQQGYYSSASHGPIPLQDLAWLCDVIEIDPDTLKPL